MATATMRPTRSPVAPRPRALDLSAIRTEAQKTKPSILFHAVPGFGKTTFGALAPNPIFLMSKRETGLETLINNNLVPQVAHFPEIEDWLSLLDAIAALTEEPHDYKTVVLDTINGFERMLHEHVCQRDFNNDWTDRGFTGYMRGYEVSQNDWRAMLNELDTLRRARNMIVILLAHTRIESFKNPEGTDYSRYEPDLHKKTWALTHGWAEIVLFGNYYTVVDKDRKAKGGVQRILYTQRTAAFDAKNRHGLPEEIDGGDNLWASLISAMKTTKEEK